MDIDWLRTLARRGDEACGLAEHDWTAVDRFLADVEQQWLDRAATAVMQNHVEPMRALSRRLFGSMREHGSLVQKLTADMDSFLEHRTAFNEASVAFQHACAEADGHIGETMHEASLTEERAREARDRIDDAERTLSHIRQT